LPRQGEIPVRFRVGKAHPTDTLCPPESEENMDNAQRRIVFEAQTENVRELNRVWVQLNRHVNFSLRQNNLYAVETDTKLLAVVYCAMAEAIFSKLIHTPFGLTQDEIRQTKNAAEYGVKFAWRKCIDLGVRRINTSDPNHRAEVRQKVYGLVDQFIYDPSRIRNKLAHGQWKHALNSRNTNLDPAVTSAINSLDVIELYRRQDALRRMATVVEDIIESPNKAHRRDYSQHIAELEASQIKMASWTLQQKIADLKKRPVRHA
jgi:hypothetical protein